MEEFEHYFRICLDRELTSEEARGFLSIVEESADVEETEEGLIMIYHIDSQGRHCYDVRLEDDITAEVGDELVEACEELFQDDDFDLESSMGIVSEQFEFADFRLDDLDKKQLSENYNRWSHQRWIDGMVQEGWRWGVSLNESDKTHPALRPWDDLSPMFKRENSKNVDYILEQLGQMGYKLIK